MQTIEESLSSLNEITPQVESVEESTLSTKVEGTESKSEGDGGLQQTDRTDIDGGSTTSGALIASITEASDYSGNNKSGEVCHESDATHTAEHLQDATCPLENTCTTIEEPSEYYVCE